MKFILEIAGVIAAVVTALATLAMAMRRPDKP